MKCIIFRSRQNGSKALENDINEWLGSNNVEVVFVTQSENGIDGKQFTTISLFYKSK